MAGHRRQQLQLPREERVASIEKYDWELRNNQVSSEFVWFEVEDPSVIGHIENKTKQIINNCFN